MIRSVIWSRPIRSDQVVFSRRRSIILGTLSIDDGDAKDDAWKKMNLYFTVEFHRCLDLFSASIGLITCSSLICNASVQFQKKIQKNSLRRSPSPKYPELSHFTLFFVEDGKGMYKDLQCTHTAIVLLIKPFVLRRSRSRCRHGLLKVPNCYVVARD